MGIVSDFIDRLLRGEDTWDGSDRRKALRSKCDIELQISMPGLSYLGRAVDVGPRGLRVAIRGPWNGRQMRRGATIELKYLTPLFDAELDTIRGKIQWAKKENASQFQIGVAFDDSVDNLRRAWIKPVLVKCFKKQINQKRTQLRVNSNIPAFFEIEGKRYEGQVRDLSTGGALLESLSAFTQGANVKLRLIPARPHAELNLNATIRRTQLVLGTYQMGLAFRGETNDKKALLKLIKALVNNQDRNRL